ncbi:MAG: glycoside hydrolase family 18 protein [Polyangiales bacterium]
MSPRSTSAPFALSILATLTALGCTASTGTIDATDDDGIAIVPTAPGHDAGTPKHDARGDGAASPGDEGGPPGEQPDDPGLPQQGGEDPETPAGADGKRVVAYFAAWGVYGRNFHVADIDASLVTHLNYAFANISDAGECVLGDPFADIDKAYPGDTWDPGVLRGSFHQLQLLKAKAPHLKTLLSIGGWTWSAHFSDAALTDASRTKFAKSCVALATTYGFDGLDVDWEYPTGGGLAPGRPEDKANFTALLAALRKELDAAAGAGKHYELTIAAPAGPKIIAGLEVGKIHGYLDAVNIMTYDFHGAWESTTNHNSPLFGSPGDPGPAGFSTAAAVDAYAAAGVPKKKLVVGAAFYGRGWAGVTRSTDGLFQAATGASPGTYESGVLDYHDIATNYVPTFKRFFSTASQVPWLYSESRQIMISYDDAESLAARGKYIRDQGLGGVMVWELSGDDKSHTLGKALWKALH